MNKNLKIYNASAGSGKTTRISREYLKIAIQNPKEFQHILAITFTKKAAAEMKERIIDTLQKIIGQNNEAEIIETITTIKSSSPSLSDEQFILNAKELLAYIQHLYSRFSISTIDSFTHKILKSYSYDFHLSHNFEVVMEEEQILQQAVEKVLDRIGHDSFITQIAIRFIEKNLNDNKSWKIEDSIFNLARQLLKDEFYLPFSMQKKTDLNKYNEKITALFNLVKAYKAEIQKTGSDIIKLLSSKGLTSEDFFQKKKGIFGFFEKAKEGSKISMDMVNKNVQKTLDEDKWSNTKEISNEIKSRMHESAMAIINKLDRFMTAKLIHDNIYSFALLWEIHETLETIKKENDLVLISDFNKTISNIVGEDPAPFIYERIGEFYKHIFIDEFQDTGKLQWKNIIPLIHNSLSNNHFNMLVGDVKQSIYRWRNSDIDQFLQLYLKKQTAITAIEKEREKSLLENIVIEPLKINYRSLTHIIHFNNDFFSKIVSAKLSDTYQGLFLGEHVIQEVFKNKDRQGMVEISFFDDAHKEDFVKSNLHAVLDRIETLHAQYGYSYDDICVLCRKNKEAVATAEFLLQKDIPVITEESLLLEKSPEIQFLINCLRWLVNSNDVVSLLSIWKYLNNRQQRTLEPDYITLTHEISHNELLKQNVTNYLTNKGLRVENFENTTLLDLFEKIITCFDLHQYDKVFIPFFLDVAYDYQCKNDNIRNNFLLHWSKQSKSLSVKIPEGINAIKIMTIHKSKGLGFPVVIFPFIHDAVKIQKEFCWIEPEDPNLSEFNPALVKISQALKSVKKYAPIYDEEYEKSILDMANLCYVAFTRAKDKLFLFSQKEEKKDSLAYWLKCFTQNQPPNEKRGDNYYLYGKYESKKETSSINEIVKSDHRFSISDPITNIQKTAAGNLIFSEKNNAVSYGNIMHEVLQKIKKPEDIYTVPGQIKSFKRMPENEQQEAQKNLKLLFENPNIQDFFSEKYETYNEKNLLNENGQLMRADKILIKDKTAVVIDFKTGQPKPEDKRQIEQYAEIMEKNNYSTKKILIYLSNMRIEQV